MFETIEENFFALLQLPEKFDIEQDLDINYFALYRATQSAVLNIAYATLKDKIKRADLLCKINGQSKPDLAIAKEMMQQRLALKNTEQLKALLSEADEKIIENAKISDWVQTWHWLQKRSYLKRMAETF